MKTVQVFFISLLAIIVLSFTTSWYFKNLVKPLSETELPKFEMPNLNLPSSEETEDYTEFTSPDKKLKLKYPSNWMDVNPETLEKINKALTDEIANNLLFVQGFKINKGAFVFLTVQELTLEKESSLEDIIEIIKEKAKEQEGGIEVTNLNIEGRKAYFESKYKTEQSSFVYSKEIVIQGNNKAYLIILSNFTKDWSGFEKEINEILNSVQYIN